VPKVDPKVGFAMQWDSHATTSDTCTTFRDRGKGSQCCSASSLIRLRARSTRTMMPVHAYLFQRLHAHAEGRKEVPDQQSQKEGKKTTRDKSRGGEGPRIWSRMARLLYQGILLKVICSHFSYDAEETNRHGHANHADTGTYTCQANSMRSCTAQKPRQSFGAQFASFLLLELILPVGCLADAMCACTGARVSELS